MLQLCDLDDVTIAALLAAEPPAGAACTAASGWFDMSQWAALQAAVNARFGKLLRERGAPAVAAAGPTLMDVDAAAPALAGMLPSSILGSLLAEHSRADTESARQGEAAEESVLEEEEEEDEEEQLEQQAVAPEEPAAVQPAPRDDLGIGRLANGGVVSPQTFGNS